MKPAAVVCSNFALTKAELSGIIYLVNREEKLPADHKALLIMFKTL